MLSFKCTFQIKVRRILYVYWKYAPEFFFEGAFENNKYSLKRRIKKNMLMLNCKAKPVDIDQYSLDNMRKSVSGSIQILARKKDMHVYCNEEGMLLGLNPSAYIPDFLRHLGFKGYIPMLVYGNAVITGKDKKLTNAQMDAIKEAYAVWYAKMNEEENIDDDDDDEVVEEPNPKKVKE